MQLLLVLSAGDTFGLEDFLLGDEGAGMDTGGLVFGRFSLERFGSGVSWRNVDETSLNDGLNLGTGEEWLDGVGFFWEWVGDQGCGADHAGCDSGEGEDGKDGGEFELHFDCCLFDLDVEVFCFLSPEDDLIIGLKLVEKKELNERV